MAARTKSLVLNLAKGFATDFGSTVRELTFLEKAENVIFEIGGNIRKVGGGTRINSSAISGGPIVQGVFDYHVTGTDGTFYQYTIAVASDGEIYREDIVNNPGVFAAIPDRSGIGATALLFNKEAIPSFAVARDALLIFYSSNETPHKIIRTGIGAGVTDLQIAELGGSPPAGRGVVFHVNRPWTWGDNSNPSTLTYGSSTSIEDYTGGDTGTITIDPDDGDRIIGATSWKNNLIVFKGPNIGSIHVISGRTPSTFARDVLARGIPLQSHNSIIHVGDDVWFMSNRGCHSLAATERFGNFAEADLTRFNRKFFREQINRKYLGRTWGVNYADKSCALWTLTPVAQSTANLVFGISYINPEEGHKPFTWTNRECRSAAIRVNPQTRRREVVFGDTAGFAVIQDASDRSLPGSTAYTMKIRTPHIIISEQDKASPRGDAPVDLVKAYVRNQPTTDGDITLNVYRDEKVAEGYTLSPEVYGFLLDRDVLDTGVLTEKPLMEVNYTDISGRARAASFEITKGTAGEDVDIYELGIEHTPSALSDETEIL